MASPNHADLMRHQRSTYAVPAVIVPPTPKTELPTPECACSRLGCSRCAPRRRELEAYRRGKSDAMDYYVARDPVISWDDPRVVVKPPPGPWFWTTLRCMVFASWGLVLAILANYFLL